MSSSLGKSEYSYHFVLKEFRPLLARIGDVVTVTDPEREVDALCRQSREEGVPCLFLNFSAPHNMLARIAAPTLHVFAWEFDTIPTESWLGDGLQDWRFELRRHKAAITHSKYAVDAVRKELGDRFPIVSIPCPLWDRLENLRADLDDRDPLKDVTLYFDGDLLDSRQIDMFVRFQELAAAVEEEPRAAEEAGEAGRKSLRERLAITKRLTREFYDEVVSDLLPQRLRRAASSSVRAGLKLARGGAAAGPGPAETPETAATNEPGKANAVRLDGVVYTSIFNPVDGRKNWPDMITAFCWAFKQTPDATLVIKATSQDVADFLEAVTDYLTRFIPFECRVVIVRAFLEDAEYRKLMQGTTYYLNTSYGEGQCLPLMEALSIGVPAVAPDTTAMADYIDDKVAFVAASHVEPGAWQHDPRRSYRAFQYKIDWLDLVKQLEESYRVAKDDPAAYAHMSAAAVARMKDHCSLDVAEARLRNFLDANRELLFEPERETGDPA